MVTIVTGVGFLFFSACSVHVFLSSLSSSTTLSYRACSKVRWMDQLKYGTRLISQPESNAPRDKRSSESSDWKRLPNLNVTTLVTFGTFRYLTVSFDIIFHFSRGSQTDSSACGDPSGLCSHHRSYHHVLVATAEERIFSKYKRFSTD